MIARALLVASLALPLAALAQEAAAPGAEPAAEPGATPPAEDHAAGDQAAEAPVALPAITVSEVRPATLRDRVVASGLVAAVEEVRVAPLVEGQPVDEVLADVGDLVEEGEVLARLSTATLELQLTQLAANRASVQAQIAQAEASLIQAEANAEEAARVAARTASLAEDGTVPQAQADQAAAADTAARAAVGVAEQGVAAAEAQMALVDAQVANAELQLGRAEVRAPVAGLVTARTARVGAVATAAGEPLFTLVRDGAMELRAEMSEGDVARVAEGQEVVLSAVGWDEPIAGTVRLVEPAIDAATRLGVARVTIDDPSLVKEGMFLQAEILVSEAEVLAVPVTAVGAGPEGAAVMRVGADGLVERVPVETGVRDGGLVAVASGLEAGDLVVTRAAAFVRDGDRVEPVRDDAETAAEPEAADETATASAQPAGEAAP